MSKFPLVHRGPASAAVVWHPRQDAAFARWLDDPAQRGDVRRFRSGRAPRTSLRCSGIGSSEHESLRIVGRVALQAGVATDVVRDVFGMTRDRCRSPRSAVSASRPAPCNDGHRASPPSWCPRATSSRRGGLLSASACRFGGDSSRSSWQPMQPRASLGITQIQLRIAWTTSPSASSVRRSNGVAAGIVKQNDPSDSTGAVPSSCGGDERLVAVSRRARALDPGSSSATAVKTWTESIRRSFSPAATAPSHPTGAASRQYSRPVAIRSSTTLERPGGSARDLDHRHVDLVPLWCIVDRGRARSPPFASSTVQTPGATVAWERYETTKAAVAHRGRRVIEPAAIVREHAPCSEARGPVDGDERASVVLPGADRLHVDDLTIRGLAGHPADRRRFVGRQRDGQPPQLAQPLQRASPCRGTQAAASSSRPDTARSRSSADKRSSASSRRTDESTDTRSSASRPLVVIV